jgi:hypothetical protein
MRTNTAIVLTALLGLAAPAVAAPPFVYRDIVLPTHDVAIDVGLGVGHVPDVTGWGLNLEFAGGITHNVELGIRTGFRLDDEGQATKADGYGRPFETETYGTNNDNMANPELRLRWAIARGTASLALEGRAYIPIEQGSRFGVMIGLPLTLRLGAVRFDTGLYVPMLFYDPETITAVSVPLHLWIQASNTLWFGPLFGWRHWSNGGGTEYPFGFGLGSALNRSVDFRAWFLFPNINRDEGGRSYGGGVALQFRVE